MDIGKKYGLCEFCGETMSIHINVNKPLEHKFQPIRVANETLATKYRILRWPRRNWYHQFPR